MKKSNITLGNKLRNYSILAGSTLAVPTNASGQIIHLSPHIVLNGGQSFDLDLNGDGISDFLFFDRSENSSALAGFRLDHKSQSFLGRITYTTNGNPEFRFGAPYVVNSGDKIGASQPWGSYRGLVNHFKSGIRIGSADLAGYYNGNEFLWGKGDTDKFVGLRIFTTGSGYNYGWARLTVTPGGRSLTLIDYAFQTKPNTPILAGDTSASQTKRLTIQLTGERCATVETSDRNTPFGDEGFKAARVFAHEGKLVTVRSFLQFDLSSIPEGSFINWARLSLFSNGENAGADSFLLHRITSSWDPATVTWNNQPAITKKNTVELPATFLRTQDYKNINVTGLVQNMVDSPATSFGFAIKIASEDQGRFFRRLSFYSPVNGKPHDNPKLVIEYTTPSLEPSVTSRSVDLSGSFAEMIIYPNPCNGIFSCNIKSSSPGNLTLKVIDMLGRTVYSQPVNASNLQMQVHLPAGSTGTYFAILQDERQGTLVSQKLVVN